MKQILSNVALLLLVASCTTTNEIIIDTKGVVMNHYENDLADCQEYSKQVQVEKKVAKGAASAAVVGGLVGAITGNSKSVKRGVGVGAVTGGAKGFNDGDIDTVRVVKTCLRGRGYKVLN